MAYNAAMAEVQSKKLEMALEKQSSFSELLRLQDRVLVAHEGRLTVVEKDIEALETSILIRGRQND